MSSLSLILSRLRYFSPVWVFASLNIVIGTWVLYIPYVRAHLGLDDGQLGIALFFYALGTFLSIPTVPYLTKRFGVGKCTSIGVLLFTLSFLLPLQATSYLWLCAALLLAGALSGFTDVAMNALVSEIEKEEGVSFMSAAHGFFSLGGVIGAGIGGLLLTVFEVPLWHMIYVGAFVVITNLLLMRCYSFQKSIVSEKETASYSFKQIVPLISIAFIALIIMGSEGAIEHWSKLFLIDIVEAPTETLAGFGFIAFSAMMTLGRFLGDSISEKIGSYNIILYGTILGLLGYGLVLTSFLYSTIIGFGIIGLGFSVIIPELFRLAGNTSGISSSAAISFVSGVGFFGFLAGPVVLGLISNKSSLWMSFLTLCVLASIAAVLALTLKMKRSNDISS